MKYEYWSDEKKKIWINNYCLLDVLAAVSVARQKSLIKIILNWNTNMATVTSYAKPQLIEVGGKTCMDNVMNKHWKTLNETPDLVANIII
jgi:precorrin-6B methylase 2